jgi:FtsP/CotA-like multicopper oxidase with cupredoxin domain
MLNGRSFPYTLRESLIHMKEDEKVKLRVINGHTESLALHIHGHKPTVTHYDGVDNGQGSYIQRDVHGMVPAQRLDLELNGKDDGLNSFGQGIWMFHDHVEKAFTTNGIGEGGDISLVVYDGFMDDRGIPMSHGMSLAPYFTKEYWKKGSYPIWQDYDEWRSLGLPDLNAPVTPSKVAVQTIAPKLDDIERAKKLAAAQTSEDDDSFLGKLVYGMFLGFAFYGAFLKREALIALAKNLLSKVKK